MGIDGADDEDTPKSPLHTFGIILLDWLVAGASFECEEEILKLIENLKDSYDSTDWLIKRWDAIRFVLSGNSEQALAAEKESLTLAKSANSPTWIINDILIDCRNLENAVHNQKREWVVDSEIQKELTNLETIVYLPVLDRYLTDIYSALSKEEFKFQTASPNTIFFGTNIGGIINNVENYFFSAVLYGSFTHMVITREILTMVLYRYDDITKKRPLLLDCLKILVVKGDAKQFKKIIDHKWDDAYAEIVSHADEIWALTDKTLLSHQNSIKQAIIAKLGLYLSDSVFEKVEKFLQTIAPTIYWGNSEDYFESINQNMRRLNCESVMRMLTGRIALAECIEQFIVQVLSKDQIDATVLSIVMQCFDDEHYVVRRKSCNCFVLLLDTKYRDLAERKLCEAAIDPSHYVRSQVLNLCKSEKIKIPEIKNELIGILATDAIADFLIDIIYFSRYNL